MNGDGRTDRARRVSAGAGTSAQREADRRRENDERKFRARHPHTGGLLLPLQVRPGPTRRRGQPKTSDGSPRR